MRISPPAAHAHSKHTWAEELGLPLPPSPSGAASVCAGAMGWRLPNLA